MTMNMTTETDVSSGMRANPRRLLVVAFALMAAALFAATCLAAPAIAATIEAAEAAAAAKTEAQAAGSPEKTVAAAKAEAAEEPAAAVQASSKNIADAVITLQKREYCGKRVLARGTVVLNGKTLEKDVDFTFSNHKNNLRPGTASVTVKGIGAYSGSVVKTFKVVRSEGNYLALPGKWVKTSKGYRYRYDHSGKHAAGRWLEDLDTHRIYRMSSKGYALTKLRTVGGKVYLFSNVTGYMKRGWREYNGYRYYFKDAKLGYAVTGWKVFDGWKLYFFDDGRMARNRVVTLDAGTYGFDADGHRMKGWGTFEKCKYYFDEDTRLAKTGTFTIDEVTYAANSTGCLVVSSTLEASSTKLVFTDEDGVVVRRAKINDDGKAFLVATEDDPEVTGWKDIGGSRYYFSPELKHMLKGWNVIGGKSYYLDETTGVMACRTSVQRDDGTWWYMGSTGLHYSKGGIEIVLNYAKSMVSKKAPYIFGGNYLTQKGTDCSGLVYYSYLKAGVKLGRTTYAQQYEGKSVGTSWSALSKAKPGDIILMYYSKPKTPEHVVMYVGKNSKGSYMIYEEPNYNMHAQYVKLSSKISKSSQISIRRILK